MNHSAVQSLPINAEAKEVWPLLLDLMSHPARYTKEIRKADLTYDEHDRHLAIRSLHEGRLHYDEHVQFNPDILMIQCTLASHPDFEGTTIYQLLETEGRTLLTVAFNWQQKSKTVRSQNNLDLRSHQIAHSIKTFAEALAAETQEKGEGLT